MPAGRRLGDIAAGAGAGFGTSGVRGLVTSLTPGLCRAYTGAFLAMPGSLPLALLIGYDLRPSSPAIAAACHDAARRLGIPTVNAGVLPTPALAFAAEKLGVPAIMVTGSHIPFDRNGLKFYRAEGEISKQDEGLILAAEAPWPLDDSSPAALPPADPAPLSLYAARYRSAFAPDALSGMRIGIYEHSSAARDLLHELFRALGAETLPLARSEGFVAIDTEAVRDEDRALALAWAAAHRLDAIVTTDGDADRPLIADETGRWLRGDTLGLLCARELRAGTVVTPVNSTTALESCGLFAEVRRTRIGSPHVIAGMQGARHHPVVGFEANGGFLLASPASLGAGVLDPLPTRDAVLPMLLVLQAARRLHVPLSQLLSGLPARFTFSGRLQDVDPSACQALLAAAEASAAGMERLFGGTPAAIDRSDGLRATLASGDILHIRLSGNAPELRCYAEAASAEAAERLCGSCLQRLAGLLSGTPSSLASPRLTG
ncbi:MAG: phosphomannomutase [Aestuariivirga sp.]|uniref:phosphomannomutase n=1 Tax=Aestuariivirga sp. TaxID=2650926 RepID=UPI0025C4D8C6|nr:phosphomannomutase [Aestuariivirga sp.]MCA3559833.1 phosphomannomutase [Aestuariivirga sp.]